MEELSDVESVSPKEIVRHSGDRISNSAQESEARKTTTTQRYGMPPGLEHSEDSSGTLAPMMKEDTTMKKLRRNLSNLKAARNKELALTKCFNKRRTRNFALEGKAEDSCSKTVKDSKDKKVRK